MTMLHGELAALATATLWSGSAISFEAAGKRIGSLALNFLRICVAFVLVTLLAWLLRGQLFPADATTDTWFWLGLSGFIGFIPGDLCLFEAFIRIGVRVSMLIYSLVPLLTAFLGWLFLGEILDLHAMSGMMMTVSGIVLVVLERTPEDKKIRLSHSLAGILLAFGGALGQAVGLVLSKKGIGHYHPIAANQIRLLAGVMGTSFLLFLPKIRQATNDATKCYPALGLLSLGAFLGPCLGVSLSLFAVQHTKTGIAATIMAIVPILLIPYAVLFRQEKVTVREILGTILAIVGVAVLFLRPR